MKWTKSLATKASKILAKHTTKTDALADIVVTLQLRSLSWIALEHAMVRNTGRTAFSFLKPAPISPVVAVEKKEEASRDKATIDSLVQELRDAKKRQEFIDRLAKAKGTPRIFTREKASGMREMTAVALCSDLHVEEPVDPESVGGINEYNLVIADKRLKNFFNGVAWQIEHQRASGHLAIRDLLMWAGGDWMSGFIHEDLIQSNQLSPTQTSLWLLPRMRDGIRMLLDRLQLEHLEIVCSYGNHGRTTPKTRIQNGASNSYEWLLYNTLAEMFRDEKRVHFEITQSPHQYAEVYDKTLHFHHGDSVRSMGGIGGIGVPLLRAMTRWDLARKADLHHVGHFHTFSDFGRLLVNGSLIGYGPFSQWIGASPEPPQQLMYMLDSKRGKCQVTPVWVGDLKKRAAA